MIPYQIFGPGVEYIHPSQGLNLFLTLLLNLIQIELKGVFAKNKRGYRLTAKKIAWLCIATF